MGPGFKYHIVTISAIFFALTIGLVVGSVFVSPQFANRQEHAIGRLQETLNTDIEEKRREIDQYRDCVATLSPLALRGRLGGAVVAVIQTGDYPEDAGRASDAVAMASPKAIVHLTLTAAMDRSSEEVQGALAGPHEEDPAFPPDRDTLIQMLASVVARGDKPATPLLPSLEREGLVRLTAEDSYTLPVRYAVIVAGSRNIDSLRTSRVDMPLIRALLKQGISVVACEGQDAQSSDMPAFRVFKDRVSTVDNVDTDIGRCALILSFSGPAGSYGTKPGADHLLPPAPEAP